MILWSINEYGSGVLASLGDYYSWDVDIKTGLTPLCTSWKTTLGKIIKKCNNPTFFFHVIVPAHCTFSWKHNQLVRLSDTIFVNWNNAFYFTLKALFVRKIFQFLSWLLGQDGLIRKIRLISEFMTSQTGWQTVKIQILPNIWRSKGNETMKFAQLIKHNMRNTFLKKCCKNVVKKLFLEHFSKKSRFNISLGQ